MSMKQCIMPRRGVSRVGDSYCCESPPTEPCMPLSRHTAQAHHERHDSWCSWWCCCAHLWLSFLRQLFLVVELLALVSPSCSYSVNVLVTE